MNGSTLSSGYFGIERRRHPVLPYTGEERRSTVRGSHALDDEAFLVRQAATGEREAFVKLYDRFVDQVFQYIYFNVGHRSVAERLTARVFLSAWQELQQGTHAKLSFSTCLYRLAHDAVSANNAPTTSATEGDGRKGSRPSQERDPVRALARLADEQRQVLILRFLVGYNTEQVAQVLGKQPAAIRTLQHRGLDGLRAILRKGAEK